MWTLSPRRNRDMVLASLSRSARGVRCGRHSLLPEANTQATAAGQADVEYRSRTLFRGEDMPRKPLEGCLRPAMRGIARWQRAAGFPGRCRWQCVLTFSRQGCPIGYREEPARSPHRATRQQQRAGASAQPCSRSSQHTEDHSHGDQINESENNTKNIKS